MGRRLYLCDWCEDHHFQSIPYPADEPTWADEEDQAAEDHRRCQCWCVTG